jgi:hypothetical protein
MTCSAPGAWGLTRRDLLAAGGGFLAAGMVVAGPAGPVLADDADAAPVDWTDQFDRADSDRVGNGWRELRGSWAIADDALTTAAGTGESVVAQTGFALGPTFTIETRLGTYGTSGRRWNGLAFNISDNHDGTQNYYALRMVCGDGTRPAAWQFLQVTGSVVNDQSLIAQGTLPVVNGRDYTVRVACTSYGVFDIAILDGTTALLASVLVAPLARLIVGGYAGAYSSSGYLRVARVRVLTTTEPAVVYDPGPLRCPPIDGRPYELPGGKETVAGRSLLDTTWAGHPVGQSVLTRDSDQYVAYYDADRQMIVAQRDVAGDAWTRQPLDSVVGWDSHNYVTMALDRAGHLHVSGNMHVVPLVYFRTTTPGDVTSLTRVPTMVDTMTEQRVTYPVFLSNADGALIFRYRDGMSGSGRDIYNIYDEGTGSWRRLLDQPLHDGEGLRNAYVDGPLLGPDGYYHITWVWRDTGDAATNQHLSYARSRDLRNWEKSDGTPLTLPITFATGEVVDPVPMNGGIINGNVKVGFDAQNRVTLSYHKFDEQGNTQVYVARRESTGWRIRQVSRWQGRWGIGGFGSLIFEVQLGRVTPLPDGNLRLDFACHGERRTWVLNRGLRAFAEVPTPAMPAEITDLRSTFPGMRVNTAVDPTATPDDTSRYVLRWESLPTNQDLPRDPPLPEAGPLEVYLLRS